MAPLDPVRNFRRVLRSPCKLLQAVTFSAERGGVISDGIDWRALFPIRDMAGLSEAWREFLGYFVKQFWPGVSTQIDKLPLTRIDYPLVVFPFLILAFIALVCFWDRPSAKRAVLGGLSSGLLFYVYFHTWVYWILLLCFLALGGVVFFRNDRPRLKGLAVFGGTLFLAAIPYAWNVIQFQSSPGYRDFALRLSSSEGRTLGWFGLGFDYLAYLLLALLVLKLFWAKERHRAVLFLAAIAAMAAVWNVQIVTGFVPAPDHWTKAANIMLFVIGAYCLFEIAKRWEVRKAWARPLVMVLLVLLPALALVKKFVNAVSIARAPQTWVLNKNAFPPELYDSWQWMDKNLPREAVVYSPSTLTAQYLMVYTHARPFLPNSILTPLSTDEMERRMLVSAKLFGVAPEMFEAMLRGRDPLIECSGENLACFYRDENFKKFPDDIYACFFSRGDINANRRSGCGRVPEERRSEVLRRYEGLRVSWDDAPEGYAYVGPWERQFSLKDFEKDPRLEAVYRNAAAAVYRILPNSSPEKK